MINDEDLLNILKDIYGKEFKTIKDFSEDIRINYSTFKKIFNGVNKPSKKSKQKIIKYIETKGYGLEQKVE